MTIRQKMFWLSGAIIVAMTLIIARVYVTIDRIATLNEQMELLHHLEIEMLVMRNHERDFLATLDPQFVARHAESHKTLQIDLARLTNTVDVSLVAPQEIAGLSDVVTTYVDSFHRVVDLQQKIGLTPTDGLYGSLREAVHQAEAELDELGSDRLLKDMLMLRRHEKDFMLRMDLKYVEKFERDFETFRRDLDDKAVPPQRQAIVDSRMQKYRQDFLALVEASKTIGLVYNTGLRADLRHHQIATEQAFTSVLEKLQNMNRESFSNLRTVAITLLLIIAVAVCVTIVALSHAIVWRLDSLVAFIRKISSDNNLALRYQAGGNDEISRMAGCLNEMLEQFGGIVQEATASSTQLSAAANQMAATMSTTTRSMVVQQQETEHVATAMDQMSSTIQEVARNAEAAATTAGDVNEQASAARQVVVENMQSMDALGGHLVNAESVISKLSEKSSSITSILDVISQVTEQTNLLALNAAIEAARAGAHGRGFAVVADEVRNLAIRTQEATREIDTMIKNLREETDNAVAVVMRSRTQGDDSMQRAIKVQDTLLQITTGIERISDMNTRIASAAEEQSAVSEEISRTLTSIKSGANSVTGAAQETAAATEQLSQLAASLQQRIRRFHI